jgi:hypothetical protein
MRVGQGGINMMIIEESETAGFKFCLACSAELRKATDNYCRRCGARQNPVTKGFYDGQRTASVTQRTNPLNENADFRQVSNPLVKMITAGMSAQTSVNLNNRYARSLILTLFSIPICLMMVLLAPLDAFVAARSIAHHLSLK